MLTSPSLQSFATRFRAAPVPRSPGVDLERPLPKHWFGGNGLATHIANGVNLLFPAGERFFVRSVNYYKDRITDPTLKEQMRGFFGQEGRHAKEHDQAARLLQEQGFDVDSFLRFYEALAYDVIEKAAPPELRLATTAACEHFTAILAENALRTRILEDADPRMMALLLWHAAEEIEHRAVAFDVLQQVNPSYALRVAGLLMATATLAGFWWIGTASLVVQDREFTLRRLKDEWKRVFEVRRQQPVFLRGIREYLRRDFHPLKNPIDGLATDYLTSVGLA